MYRGELAGSQATHLLGHLGEPVSLSGPVSLLSNGMMRGLN